MFENPQESKVFRVNKYVRKKVDTNGGSRAGVTFVSSMSRAVRVFLDL